jgi:predicted dehydrogenase
MTLRVALIGAGRIARSHLAVLPSVPDLRLVAVVDPNPAAAQPIADRAGARWYAHHDCDELVEAIDVALVCTPPSTHHAITAHLLERGRAVLCEKPIDLAARRARELFELAHSRRTLLMMTSKYRYCDDVARAKAWIEKGHLGRISGYQNVFAGFVDMRQRWNADRKISGGGVLMDNGTHAADVARYLLGPIASVQAEFGTHVQDLTVEDNAQLLFKSMRGTVGHVDLSWSSQRATSTYIDIYGTEGSLLVGWTESRFRRTGSAEWSIVGRGYDERAAFTKQLRNFADAARGRAAPLIDAGDAVASVALVEAAYASAAANKWTPVRCT